MTFSVHKLTRPNVRALRAYEAKEIPCQVKLDANESPYAPSAVALRRIIRNLGKLPLNRYPDPEARALRSLLARILRCPVNGILLGNGSDELISLLITTFGGPVLYPVPTFTMYGIIAKGFGAETVEVPLNEQFDLDESAMLKAIRKHRPRLIFLSSPNNPTGNCFSRDRIERILVAAPGIVVVDEAYQPFADNPTFAQELKSHPNLVVLRTLSKIGMASLRVGLMISSEGIAHEVNKIRLPFNVNALSQMAALEALGGGDSLAKSAKKIATARKRLIGRMCRLPGVQPFPSDANFILFRVKNPGAIHQGLLRQGVLIRNLDGVVSGCLRVTVGTPKENTLFIQALENIVR